VADRGNAIIADHSQCIGCSACTRVCPTRALRVRDKIVQTKKELCLNCGACIVACKHGALRARTSTSADLERFKIRVAVPSMVLYGQFGDDVRPGQVLSAFRSLGFDLGCDISWVCELVAAAIDAYLTDCHGPWPQISMTCPAVVRLIQVKYPDLIPHLIPIDPPREVAPKLHRGRLAAEYGVLPSDVGMFYISPCTALVDAIERPLGRRASSLDGAFSISELYGPLLRVIRNSLDSDSGDQVSIRGLRWVLANGEIPGMRNVNSISVRGLQDVMYVLDRIEAGRFSGADFINAYICSDGCFSGQLTIASRYTAQRYLHQIVRRLGDPPPVKEERVRSLLQARLFDLDDAILPSESSPPATDLRLSAARQRQKRELWSQLPKRDCGACGAPDCDSLAGDVTDGEAQLTDCPFFQVDKLLRDNPSAKIASSGRRLVVSACCPRCNMMLTQGQCLQLAAVTTDSARPVRATLSAVVGELNTKLSGEVPEGTISQISCPECGKSLEIDQHCSLCSAPLVQLNLRGGGTYRLCSRRGCGMQIIAGPCTSEGIVPLVGAPVSLPEEGS
jgi:NAD-dependent dihydropyrimidine dehydrogenase PreA subunit